MSITGESRYGTFQQAYTCALCGHFYYLKQYMLKFAKAQMLKLLYIQIGNFTRFKLRLCCGIPDYDVPNSYNVCFI